MIRLYRGAVSTTAVASHEISVITRLIRVNGSVAAALTGSSSDGAAPASGLKSTGIIATIAVYAIAIIADFGRNDDAVATFFA
jgi:hypothetical protein